MQRRHFMKALSAACLSLVFSLRPADVFAVSSERKAESSSPVPGKAKVLRVFRPDACTWNFIEGDYTESIDYEAVKDILAAGLTELTGESNPTRAWRALIPWRDGDRIVIKPNLGNIHVGYSEVIMTSPQVISAIIESLLAAGFPARAITVFDLTAHESDSMKKVLASLGVQTLFMPSKKTLLEKIMAKLHLGAESLDSTALIRMRKEVTDQDGENVQCFMPRVLTEADHLINVPVLKGHQFLLQSSVLKNHFGVVRFSNRNSYPVVLHGEDIESHLVDINANVHVRGKTRLCVVDGLLGAACFTRGDNDRRPTPWRTAPLNSVPGSLFFSTDPVALESVTGDLIATELIENGFEPFTHQYLHVAEKFGLGVHEHRDQTGGYSRIDYQEVELEIA